MRINNSRVQAYQRCPRFYYYRYVENLVTRREAVPLIVGRAVHRALASHHSNKQEDAEAQVRSVFNETRDKAPWMAAELEDLQKQEDYTVQLYRWYKEQYPQEPWTPLAPEVEGYVPLGTHTLYFRIDALVSWLGHPWLFETKTTSQFGATFFRKFRLDPQISLYIYAVNSSLGMMPKGAIIDAIRKSRKLDTAAFQREPVTRTQQQIDECVAQTIQQVDIIEMLSRQAAQLASQEEATRAKAIFQMHFNECVRYNRTCDYHELCSGQIVDQNDLYAARESDYTEHEEED